MSNMFNKLKTWFKRPVPRWLHKTISIFKTCVFFSLVLIVVLVVLPLTPLSGNRQSLVVLSGSMEPTIKVGSLIFTSSVDPTSLVKDDIITFLRDGTGGTPVTHRITEVSEDGSFVTKGDANDSADGETVLPSEVQGKLVFAVPLLGYVVNFAKTPKGLFILVILPAILIIIDELKNIKNELEKKYKEKYEKELKRQKNSDILVAIVLVFTAFSFSSGTTLAYFTDTATSTGNTFTAGVWDDNNSAEDSIVLNEILPNPEGSDSASGLDGEWVELYNNGDASVDVTNWYIKDASTSGNKQTISASTTYGGQTVLGVQGSGTEWLVLFMGGSILDNGGDTVTLYDSNDNEIDSHEFDASSNDGDNDSYNTPEGTNINNESHAGTEGKSFARIPDGTGDWVDPIPTPGDPNKLEENEPVEEEVEEKDEEEEAPPEPLEKLVEDEDGVEEADSSGSDKESIPLEEDATEEEEEEKEPEKDETVEDGGENEEEEDGAEDEDGKEETVGEGVEEDEELEIVEETNEEGGAKEELPESSDENTETEEEETENKEGEDEKDGSEDLEEGELEEESNNNETI